MTDRNIRLANPLDLPQVVAIDLEAFSPSNTAEEPEIFTKRMQAFPDGFLVAEFQGQVVGYATSEKWLEEREPIMNEDPLLTHQVDGKIFCITGMAVRQNFQRQGIGSALLARMVAIAYTQHCERIVLETTHAQAFYVRHGFANAHSKLQWGVKLTIMQLDL